MLLSAIISFFISLVIILVFGRLFIICLQKLKAHQPIRNDGPASHLKNKLKTPTGGGIMLLLTITVVTGWLIGLKQVYWWLLQVSLWGFAAIGWLDDWRKLQLDNSKGLSAKHKYFMQSILALVLIAWLYLLDNKLTIINIPFMANQSINLRLFAFVVLAYLVIVGSSNAVNLTDGLDGLVAVPIMLSALGFAILAYLASNYIILIFCSAIIGVNLGFLWFNSHPAQIFMGDVGSLSLGAIFAIIAIILQQELLWLIFGGLFVLEALSVILQVGYFKLTGGKRIFKMAPLHHHFELTGWKESKIVVRFWIISIILLMVSLLSIVLNR